MIGPDLGALTHFTKAQMDQLEAVYQKTKKQEETAQHNAAGEIMTSVKELAEAAGQIKTQADAKEPD
jgi:hypothetical protein